MDCKEFSNLLDAWRDGALTDEQQRQMDAHAAACPDCAALWALRKDCRSMDEAIEVPEGFSSSWRQLVREEEEMEEKMEKRKARKFNWQAWAAVAAALVFLIGGTLISRDSMAPRTAYQTKDSAAESAQLGSSLRSAKTIADSGAATNFSYSAPTAPAAGAARYAMADMDMALEEDAMEAEESGPAEKIIRSASFTLKTTHYDEDLQRLQDLAQEKGGRVEYLSSSGDASSGQTRYASLTLRIPAGELDGFLSGVQGIGDITAMTQEMQDVSDSYYDTQTRLNTQRAKLERLQAMMSAAEDVSDLIEIESAIADAQYYIDRYTSQLKSYDSKVDYSTVRATVREVRVTELVQVTLGQRLLTGLQDSLAAGAEFLEDMLIFVVSALPWLAGIGIVAFIVVKIVKKHKKTK